MNFKTYALCALSLVAVQAQAFVAKNFITPSYTVKEDANFVYIEITGLHDFKGDDFDCRISLDGTTLQIKGESHTRKYIDMWGKKQYYTLNNGLKYRDVFNITIKLDAENGIAVNTLALKSLHIKYKNSSVYYDYYNHKLHTTLKIKLPKVI